MYAQRAPVCGNLFHHAVEMFLKGGLGLKRPLSELQDMGTNPAALEAITRYNDHADFLTTRF